MRRFSVHFCTLGMLVFSACLTPVQANEMPEELAKAKVIWKADEDYFLPAIEGAAATDITIPNLENEGRGDLALRFRARYHSPQPSGLATSLLFTINGTKLGPDNALILNRTDLAMVSGEELPWAKGWWGRLNGNWCVVLQYVPDFETLEPRIVGNEDQGHWFLIDINNLVQPGEDIQIDMGNALVFDETIMNSNQSSPDRGIVIEDFSLVEINNNLKP